MAILVFRNSDQTGISAYGREITESAALNLEFATMVRIGFSTKQSQFSVLIRKRRPQATALSFCFR
jgi:hypothetical protein